MYAPCLNNERSAFFKAVSEVAADAETPWAVLGDFNMYRFSHEKSRGRICWTTMEHFNSWIQEHGLDDILIENKLFTWSNKRSSPTLVRLDRALVNAAWSLSFMQTVASCPPYITSDHAPILLQFSVDTPKSKFFRMENHWLEMEESREIITSCCNRGLRHISSPATLINFKMRRLRAAL